MDEETRRMLLAADDAECFESPRHLDAIAVYRDVKSLEEEISRITGLSLKFDPMEDASICASYGFYVPGKHSDNFANAPKIMEAVILITFSNFGRFFTTTSTADEKLPEFVIDNAIKFIESRGFTYLSGEVLDEPYSGEFGSDFDPLDGAPPRTWAHRFFDFS